jgi:hypothetical protein
MILLPIAVVGCKGNDKTGATKAGSGSASAAAPAAGQPVTLDQRCEQLAKVCADTGKHVEKMIGECKDAAQTQVAKGCKDLALAAYDCYEKQLCMGSDKVWTLDDMRVLSDRHAKCTAERDTLRACTDAK